MTCHSKIAEDVARAGWLIKLYCGIANNAAWTIALEAIDHARLCKGYAGKTKQLFNRCTAAWHAYERGLAYSPNSKAFSVAAMPPDVREWYGNITDRDYYEFWCATGATLHSQHRSIVTSLCNKYRIPLVRQNVEDAEHLAWVFTAQAALMLADDIRRTQIAIYASEGIVRREALSSILRQFSIKLVADTWERAASSLCPILDDLTQTQTEDKNVLSGIEQVYKTWINMDNIRMAYIKTSEDYPEMFRTKGTLQKALRRFSEAWTA